MKATPASQFFFLVGSAWLIISGISELSTTSESNRYGSWFEEESLIALNQRGQGSLKVGLGLGFMGAACLSSASASTADTASSQKRRAKESVQSSGGVSGSTSEFDFDACVKLYREKGGTEVPIISNSWMDGDELTLNSQENKLLADFSKRKTGEWYMSGKYR